MSSLKERDEFLKRVFSISKENNRNLSYDEVYNLIVFNGISNLDRRIDLSKTSFNVWMDHFKNRNTQCFVSYNWTYFCQFINYVDNYDTDCINSELKMYIPIKAEYVEEGGKRIFEFLDQNNIRHHSKIGKKIRIDNVVVRLFNKSDAKKLSDFVKHDSWFRDKMNKPSVFCYEEDGIGYGVDGSTSYNSCVACYITLYINYCRENNLEPSINHFYSYVENYYKLCFLDRKNTAELVREFAQNCNLDEESINESLYLDYKRITELILKQKNPNFNMNDFISHYTLCNNENVIKKEIDFFKGKDMSFSEEELDALLSDVYKVMVSKYGEQQTRNNLFSFVKTGDCNLITRDKNYRNIFREKDVYKSILELTKKKNIDSLTFISKYMKSDRDKIETLYYDCVGLIASTYNAFRIEYSHEQRCLQIRNYLITGNKLLITKNLGARDNVVNFNLINKFRLLMNHYNLDIDGLLSYMIDGYKIDNSLKR